MEKGQDEKEEGQEGQAKEQEVIFEFILKGQDMDKEERIVEKVITNHREVLDKVLEADDDFNWAYAVVGLCILALIVCATGIGIAGSIKLIRFLLS